MRASKEKRIIKRIKGKPIVSMGETLELPNLSGVQRELKAGTHGITSDDIAEGSTNLYFTTANETDPIFLSLSGSLSYVAAESDPIFMALSGSLAHFSDASDPHGATLTQTNIVGTTISGSNILNTGDHTTSGSAYVTGIITHTSATPPTASNFPRGTIYVQYTA